MSEWPQIDGETPIDPSGLKIRGVTSRAELSKLEAENVRSAVVKYLSKHPTERSAPFTYEWCCDVHKNMFDDVWKWAGKIRTNDETNFGSPHGMIVQQMAVLLDNAKHWSEWNIDIVEQSAMLHHGAVRIHPFPNGNGRWSRMLANIWLMLHGAPPVDWPSDIGAESSIRDEYLVAIHTADGGNYAPLIALHQKYMRNDAD